ncbi:hypothetical protein G6011_07504 [Alternaria panax]|uniref:Uncharacterized protein n=1 Tax=Alternaria panax TaxID=48097 RepID=A0AAD4FE31_9PLEO|nr:hypothetical protein G6011_07504 [Alternaria panax]
MESIYSTALSLSQDTDRFHETYEITEELPRVASKYDASQNSTTSPLLCLPAEVRNKVFEYVCNGLIIFMGLGVGRGKDEIYVMDGADQRSSRISSPFVALQQTCRQIYSETALLPFSANKCWYFTTGSLPGCKELLYNAQFQCIQHICFTVKINTSCILAPLGDLCLERLQGLERFPKLKEVTIYMNTEEWELEHLLEDLKTAMKDELEKVVSASVKVVYEVRCQEHDFISWPSAISPSGRK